MADYISSIICAGILSGAASLLSPEKWRKYVGVITGLIVICAVIAPLSDVRVEDIFSSISESNTESVTEEGEELRMDMVEEELQKRVEEDVEKRLNDEFGISAEAHVEIGVDDEGKITGVKKIEVSGERLTEAAKKRLCEVYGIEEAAVR